LPGGLDTATAPAVIKESAARWPALGSVTARRILRQAPSAARCVRRLADQTVARGAEKKAPTESNDGVDILEKPRPEYTAEGQP